ncbi:hypothetical protein EGW08_010810, partial [Elysia chlorotica]
LHPSFRHEGHIFFIYDHRVKTEEDDPSDAILYFYPTTVTTDQQIGIVGGIIGITDFCLEFVPQSMPTIVKLNGHHFALLQHEEFIIGLACSEDIPDKFLTEHMQFVWSTFILYQGSLGAIRERVCEENFVKELNRIWDMYLPLCQIHSDPLSQAFKVLPYVQLHKSQGSLYLHASHILQRSLRYKGVVAGALFSWKKVLCSQLSNSLTRQLLLLMTQSEFPCVEANSVLELPGGVRLLHVFIPDEEYSKLTHRRKRVFSSHSLPIMAVTGLGWANQAHSFKQASHQGGGTVFAASTGQHSGGRDRDTQADKNPQSPSEVYHTASEGSRTNKGRWSFPHQDSGVSATTGGGVTSGTDSEVFVDTLTEASFDRKQPDAAPGGKLGDGSSSTAAIDVSSIPGQSRDPDLYVPPRGYTSSSEPNSPAQRNVVVFAEVHNNSLGSLVQRNSEQRGQEMDDQIDKDSHFQEGSNPDNVLEFGQSAGTPIDQKGLATSENAGNEENFGAGFSSISNLRSDMGKGENSGRGLGSKGVEPIVEFIHPSPESKNSQVVSSKATVNGIVSSVHRSEERKDLQNLSGNSGNKKLSDVGNSHASIQTISALDSSQSQSASVSNGKTDFVHKLPENSQHSISVDLTSFNSDTHQQESDLFPPDFVILSNDAVPGSNRHRQKIVGNRHGELGLHGNTTADKLDIDEPQMAKPGKLQNQASADFTESCDQVESLTNQISGHMVSNPPSNISSSEQDLEKENKSPVERSISSNSSKEGRNTNEEDSSIRQAMARSKHDIDASMEVRLSGDESSAHSSSELHRQGMDSSTMSLAPDDLGPSKMRLVFEPSESENSDTGIMSPLSDRGSTRENCLSPVDEIKTNNAKKTFREGDEDYALRRLSSDFESRHVKSSHGDKSMDSSYSPSMEPAEAGLSSDNASARSSPGTGKLHKMTLYAQGHSDTLLLLLLSKNASCSKSYVNSLWKTCLSHLAELDFEVKDAERHMKDDSENIGAAYQYMRYDSFSQSLKGSALLPVSSLANEIVDTCVKMHDTFETMPDVQDITYRSHSACCFGHRAINTETYFQLGQPRNASGICAQNDRTFSLEQLAGRILQNDVKISIL